MTDRDTRRFGPAGRGPAADGDDPLVERLVRMAASGPEVPADGAARIKNAIRPAWQAEVRVRTRGRRLRIAAAGLAAAAVIAAIAVVVRTDRHLPAPTPPAATLAAATGPVEITPEDGTARVATTADLGTEIAAGAWLRTGDDTRVALELADGRSVRLDVGTRLRVASAAGFELDRGAVYVDTRDVVSEHAVEIQTRLGVARDIGTQFEVRRPDGELVVRVREGRVELDRGGDDLVIHHGNAVTVDPSGAVLTAVVRSDGPEWDWTQTVAPPFVIEGRTALAFLDWVSSETGRWIRFSDDDVERIAATTVLHGSIDGLAPAEAVDVVLPGCGLAASRAPGSLVIRRLGGTDDPG